MNRQSPFSKIIIPALFIVVLAGGCSHTNNLNKYQFNGKKVLYEYKTDASAADIHLNVTPRKGASTVEVVGTILGAGIASHEVEKKLREVVNTDTICRYIGQSFARTAEIYLKATPVSEGSSADYIVQTKLRKYRIYSSEFGISTEICAEIRMLDTHTGNIVWEDTETEHIPLQNTSIVPVVGGWRSTAGTVMGVVNAVQVAAMSKEELNSSIQRTAYNAGEELGETLRKDISKMNE